MIAREAGAEDRTTHQNPTRILDLLARIVLVSLPFAIRAEVWVVVLRTFGDLSFHLLAENLSEDFKVSLAQPLAILALVELYWTANVYSVGGWG